MNVAGNAQAMDTLSMQLERVHTGVHCLAVRTLVIPREVRLQVVPSTADTLEADDTFVHPRTGRIRIKDAVRVVASENGLDWTRWRVSRFKTWKDTKRKQC